MSLSIPNHEPDSFAIEDEVEDMGLTEENIAELISDYVALDEDIKEVRSNLKDLNNQKKKMTEKLITFMEKNGVNDIQANDGKVVLEEKERPDPLNKGLIESTLESELDSDVANKIADTLFRKRPTTNHVNLKLVRKTFGKKKN
jgi:vacuolar-type H+-ATPase subunit I/STV1